MLKKSKSFSFLLLFIAAIYICSGCEKGPVEDDGSFAVILQEDIYLGLESTSEYIEALIHFKPDKTVEIFTVGYGSQEIGKNGEKKKGNIYDGTYQYNKSKGEVKVKFEAYNLAKENEFPTIKKSKIHDNIHELSREYNNLLGGVYVFYSYDAELTFTPVSPNYEKPYSFIASSDSLTLNGINLYPKYESDKILSNTPTDFLERLTKEEFEERASSIFGSGIEAPPDSKLISSLGQLDLFFASGPDENSSSYGESILRINADKTVEFIFSTNDGNAYRDTSRLDKNNQAKFNGKFYFPDKMTFFTFKFKNAPEGIIDKAIRLYPLSNKKDIDRAVNGSNIYYMITQDEYYEYERNILYKSVDKESWSFDQCAKILNCSVDEYSTFTLILYNNGFCYQINNFVASEFDVSYGTWKELISGDIVLELHPLRDEEDLLAENYGTTEKRLIKTNNGYKLTEKSAWYNGEYVYTIKPNDSYIPFFYEVIEDEYIFTIESEDFYDSYYKPFFTNPVFYVPYAFYKNDYDQRYKYDLL